MRKVIFTIALVAICCKLIKAQNCDEVLKTYYSFTASSKQEFTEKMNSVYSYFTSQSNKDAGSFNFNAVVPIDGVPVPVGFGTSHDDFTQNVNQMVSKLETEQHYSFEHFQTYQFLPKEAYDSWNKCNVIKYGPIDIVSSFSKMANNYVVNLTLRQNSLPSAITECYYSSVSDNKSVDLKKEKKLTSITESNKISFNIPVKSDSSDFYFYFKAEKYNPVVYWFKPEKIVPGITQVEVPTLIQPTWRKTGDAGKRSETYILEYKVKLVNTTNGKGIGGKRMLLQMLATPEDPNFDSRIFDDFKNLINGKEGKYVITDENGIADFKLTVQGNTGNTPITSTKFLLKFLYADDLNITFTSGRIYYCDGNPNVPCPF